MTPKEKSIELFNKFYIHTDGFAIENAKRFALIAVDEILWEIIKYADNSREYVVENSNYWQEVKQEIENL